jgi:uncharacterized membrane protein
VSQDYDPTTKQLARGLGWASLGLGIAMTGAPRLVSKLSGVDDSALARLMVRIVGIRELVHAAGLLAGRAEWVWTRVGGDAMDLPTLLIAMSNREGSRRLRTAMATAAVLGLTAADVYTAMRTLEQGGQSTLDSLAQRTGMGDMAKRAGGGDLAKRAAAMGGELTIEAGVTVRRSPEECYAFWHDFGNLPRFMLHLADVHMSGDRRTHWTVEAPFVGNVEWDADIIDDRPNELIMWKSVDGASVPNSGTVHFDTAPGGRGTEVRVQMRYVPPAGKLSVAAAKIIGEAPDQQVKDDLRRFKQVMELGEIVRSEGSPEGTHTQRLLRQRPAQPLPT